MKRAGDELGLPKADWARLRTLEDGHFFAFGPALSPQIVELKVGPVTTTHPRPGQGTTPTPPARTKIRKVLEQLEDLPAEAEEEARTVAELQRKNRELQASLRKAQSGAPPADAGALEDARALGRREVANELGAQREAMLRGVQALNARSPRIARHLEVAAVELQKAQDAVREPFDLELPEISVMTRSTNRAAPRGKPTSARPASVPRRAIAPLADGLTGPEQRVLDAIAWQETLGIIEPQQVAVAFLAGYKYGAGSFNNPRGSLRSQYLVQYLAGGRIALTDEGRALAHAPEQALTVEELQRRVLERLPGPEQRVLRPLLEAYPNQLSKEDTAHAAGYTPGAGSFNNPCGRLRSLGLVDYPEPGYVKAEPVLFPEATPGSQVTRP